MTDWMLLMEEVFAVCVIFLIFIIYLFYVRYPVDRDLDIKKRARA